MVRMLMIVVAVAMCTKALHANDPETFGGGWRCERMDVVIDLTQAAKKTARIKGRMRVRLEIDSSFGPSFGVNSRSPVMTFAAATGPEGTTAVLNAKSPMAQWARVVHIRSNDAFVHGDEIEVKFTLQSEGDSFQWLVDERLALASWTESWLPTMFPPPGEMPGVAQRQSSGTTTFHLPAGWSAITNGRLIRRDKTASGATDVWETQQRVARSFAAGSFDSTLHEANGRQIGVHLLSDKPLGAQRQVELLAAALEAQEARFGPYPYPTYAIVEVPNTAVQWYASSEQGFIMAQSAAFGYEHGNLPLWAHEMAHGWWGNLIGTEGPGAIVCSESLAQYSAVIAIEAIEGEDAATQFLRFSRSGYAQNQCARGYFAIARMGGDVPLSQITPLHRMGHDLSDAKGHWVFHMLRARVGDEVFFVTLRGLIERFAGRNMRLADVRAAFVQAAPEADLETFFEQWLDRTGAPVLDAEWLDGDLVITQSQAGEPYSLDVEVALELSDGTIVRHRAAIHERQARVAIDVDGSVVAIHLDPDHRLLIWTPDYGERPAGP